MYYYDTVHSKCLYLKCTVSRRTVQALNPGGSEIFRTCPDRPWGPTSLLYNEYRLFSEVKERPGATLTSHPLIVPWSWKSKAIPLLPLWAVGLYRASVPVQGCTLPYSRAIPLLPLRAVQPVQSLSACTRVHFTISFFTLQQFTNVKCYVSYNKINLHISMCTFWLIFVRNRRRMVMNRLKFIKHEFCIRDGIKCFACFILPPKSTTEIAWWPVG
jgi:hypothetical protein